MITKLRPTSVASLLLGGVIVGAATTATSIYASEATFGPWAAHSAGVTEAPLTDLDHPAVQQAIQDLDGFSRAFSAVADTVRPSVVSIQIEKTVQGGYSPFGLGGGLEGFFGGPQAARPQPVIAGGTGIIVSEDGHILTNNHVVEDADTITVHLADGREFKGVPLGTDPKTDLAVIDIDATGLTPARLGRSEDARVGEWVVAIGHPYSLDYTVTAGIVSAKGRTNLTRLVQYQDFIQTDASINPGNSGGPLVNLHGEVIGINTLIDGRGNGLGFAIPSDMARGVMNQLIASGHVVRPWLGVRIQDVDSAMAQALGYSGEGGAFVAAVEDDSPAARAGLRPEDLIVEVDGAKVHDSGALVNSIIEREVGEDLELTIFRDGQRQRLDVTTAAMPEDDAVASSAPEVHADGSPKLGVELRKMDAQLASQLGMNEARGVVVWGVDPTGPAARAGVHRGDVILEVNRSPVSQPQQVADALKGADAVLLKLYRSGDLAYVAVDL